MGQIKSFLLSETAESLVSNLDSIYCIPLQAPGAMIREIKDRAAVMEHVIKDVLIKHPLVCESTTHFLRPNFDMLYRVQNN